MHTAMSVFFSLMHISWKILRRTSDKHNGVDIIKLKLNVPMDIIKLKLNVPATAPGTLLSSRPE